MNSIRETYPDSASDSEAGDELSDHEDHSETFTVPLPPPFTGSAHLTGDILESLVVKKFGASVVLQEADADSDASSGVSDTSIRTTQSSVSTATQRPSSPYQGFLAAKKVVPTKHSVDIKSLPLPSASSVQKVGTVRSILDNVIVVEADRGSPTLDLDTIMFLGQAPLGRVFDVFGPVIRPLYSIRFESADEVAVTTASVGAEIFVVPTDPRLTSFVFVEDLRRHRGTDASWEDNTELPNEMEEFSGISAPDPFVTATSGSSAAVGPHAIKKRSRTKSPKKAIQRSESAENGDLKRKRSAAKKAPTRKRKSCNPVSAESLDVLGDLPHLNVRSTKLAKSRSAADVPESWDLTAIKGGGATISTSSSSILAVSTSSAGHSSGRGTISVGTSATRVLTIGGGGGFTARTCSSSSIDSSEPSSATANPRFAKVQTEDFTLYPSSFNIVLCVDNQEIHGKGNIRSKTDIILELKKHSANFEVRSLKAGDFLWIAREKIERDTARKPRELVLDFIAERKRGDDLATSIKDGRYTCQKYRMKTSTLKRIIYIVEDANRFMNKGLSEQALFQALANIEVQDRYIVKHTANLRATVDYLLTMTRYLHRVYSTKTLRSCSYSERSDDNTDLNLSLPRHSLLTFAAFSAVAKTNQVKSVSQAFLLQLLALDGVSPAKASAIVSRYPTLRRLIVTYEECESEQQKMLLLRDIKFGAGFTSIGPTLSKKLYQLYCTESPFIL